MQFGLNAFEVFRDYLPKPLERGSPLREEQMARPASVIIRRTKSANRHTKMRSLFQQFRPVTLQLPIGPCVPDLNGFSHSQQIITVPVRGGRGFQVVTDARAESSSAKGAADVGVIARHDVVSSQATDLQAFHLGHKGNQHVSSFGLGQVHRHHPNMLPFQPQWLASTSVKLR